MKAIILGATGAVGRDLTEMLLKTIISGSRYICA